MARKLAEAGLQVLVLEKRAAPGGNVRCETDEATGIEVHTYGSHIFHTHLPEVWDFVRRFTEFNGYQHKVLARHGGKTYFLPLGLTLVNQFYGLNLTPEELPGFIAKEAGGGTGEPANFEEQAISFVGRPLYEAFIREYTRKQWGTDPKNLPASIIKRLPVRTSYDVNYFPDYCQGIPLKGYNAVFEAMLDHPGITLECGVDWAERRGEFPKDAHVFYSGPLDALYGYRFGELPWRSLRFEHERKAVKDWQGTSVVNYTGAEEPWTRIHEFKHYHPEDAAVMNAPETLICREYPETWKRGAEPYYPVEGKESAGLVEAYRGEAAKDGKLTVGGRLGEYKYYDMDKSIEKGLEAYADFTKS